jgi:nitrogen fixation protein NifX
MDKKIAKVAVASRDGIVVNEHFGRASLFYIYEISEGMINPIEVRKITPVCHSGNHDYVLLTKNLRKLADCDYMLVSRIGTNALNIAKKYDIEVFEIPGMIMESIEQLYKFIQIKQLFYSIKKERK